MTRRRIALALTVAAVAASPSLSAHAASGTGSVTDTLTATVVTGGLTLAGTGTAVAFDATPGTFTSAAGATLLTIADTTGTSNGWVVTATYSSHDPAVNGVTDLGGANVKVSTTNVTPDVTLVSLLATGGLNPVTDAVLSSPVAVLSTGTATGSGISTATVGYKVKVPANASTGAKYGGKVTYTIASVR